MLIMAPRRFIIIFFKTCWGHVEGPAEIDIDYFLEVFTSRAQDQFVISNAGIVNQNVSRSQCRFLL